MRILREDQILKYRVYPCGKKKEDALKVVKSVKNSLLKC